MKTHRLIPVVLLAVCMSNAIAQQDISGTWAGVLTVAPETNLNLHFILTRDSGGLYSAVVTSPDTGGIKDVAASAVNFETNRLTINVDELSGVYDGQWEEGAFVGEWQQEGAAYALRLAPYEAPVLSQAAIDSLTGSWVGSLETPIGALTIVSRFETNAAGEFVGFFSSPDQGPAEFPVTDIQLTNGDLSFKIPRVQGEYSAVLAGAEMVGTWKQGGMELPLAMNRGEFESPKIQLSAEATQQLVGSWVGELELPARSISVVYRFETNPEDEIAGFFDSPDEGVSGVPITEIELVNGSLSLTIPGRQARYFATISGDQMVGTWGARQNRPLTMNRGEYEPVASHLDLSPEAMQQLSGVWLGTLEGNEVIFRFETTADGSYVAFLTVPAGGLSDLPVSSASLTNDQFALRVEGLLVEYSAEFAGTEMSGQWQQGPPNNRNSRALRLVKQ